MNESELEGALAFVDKAFLDLAGIERQGARLAALVSATDGKVYELRVLAWLLEAILQAIPGAKAEMAGSPGAAIELRWRPGKVDTNAPHIVIYTEHEDEAGKSRLNHAAVWMNVEVTSLWSMARKRAGTETATDYHEMDIAVTSMGVQNGESIDPHELLVGVECKDRQFDKGTVREILGIRRLVSFSSDSFPALPIIGYPAEVNQWPPSRLFLISSQPLRADYDKLEPHHGVVVRHLAL